MTSTSTRITAALITIGAVAAVASPLAGAAASPTTPLRLSSLPTYASTQVTPGERLYVEGRVTNRSSRTIRNGRFMIYATRKMTDNPTGAPDASLRLDSLAPGRSITDGPIMRFSIRARGRYRIIACVTSENRRKRCQTVPGALTVGETPRPPG